MLDVTYIHIVVESEIPKKKDRICKSSYDGKPITWEYNWLLPHAVLLLVGFYQAAGSDWLVGKRGWDLVIGLVIIVNCGRVKDL